MPERGEWLRISQALRVLGLEDKVGRQLLKERGLIKHLKGRPRVWSASLATCDDESWEARQPPKPIRRPNKSAVDRMKDLKR